MGKLLQHCWGTAIYTNCPVICISCPIAPSYKCPDATTSYHRLGWAIRQPSFICLVMLHSFLMHWYYFISSVFYYGYFWILLMLCRSLMLQHFGIGSNLATGSSDSTGCTCGSCYTAGVTYSTILIFLVVLVILVALIILLVELVVVMVLVVLFVLV